ncbi:MAG: pantetheine-phosphate adenylyltransferase [Firmicutes bacterium]|nr:pantetheine-phosphate adenylyltransferase [Bacillota bacterium]
MTKALYSGSFDPLTMGHLDIIERAAKLYDELTIGIIGNPSKQAMFTLEEREEMLKEVLKDYDNVNVDHFSGLLADYVNRSGFDVVVRGLRNTTDFDYEMQMAQVNDRLFNDSTETVFLMADPRYSFISSSVVRDVSSLGGNIEGLVPEEILKRMVK